MMSNIFQFALIVLTSASIVAGQRPSYAGFRPIGYPETPEATTAGGLGDRFGEVDGTTPKLPIEANGDLALIDRISKLPIDSQPFWYINWQALEANRKEPQTYPHRPGGFNHNFNLNIASSSTTNAQANANSNTESPLVNRFDTDNSSSVTNSGSNFSNSGVTNSGFSNPTSVVTDSSSNISNSGVTNSGSSNPTPVVTNSGLTNSNSGVNNSGFTDSDSGVTNPVFTYFVSGATNSNSGILYSNNEFNKLNPTASTSNLGNKFLSTSEANFENSKVTPSRFISGREFYYI